MEYNNSELANDEYDYIYWYYDYADWLEEDQQDVLRSFSTACYGLFFCISLAGNSFLLWVLLKREGLRRTSYLLLLHLTVSDLIFTLPLPIWAANTNQSLVMSDMACRLMNTVWSLGLYSYMAFLTAMTVYRYRGVVHAVPNSSFTPHMHTVCGILWLLCLVCSVPELVIRKIDSYDDDDLYCIQSNRADIVDYFGKYIQIIIFFFLPFGVIVFCYLWMWIRIRKSRMARKNQAIRLILLIVVGFFICWAPYNIFLLLLLLSFHGVIPQGAFKSTDAFAAHYTVSNALICLHCGLSPLILIFGAQKFRKHLPLSHSFRRLLVRESVPTATT